MKTNNPNKKSETLLKKYFSIQFETQLKPRIYSSGFDTFDNGVSPAFDHNSNQSFTPETWSLPIDQDTFSKQEKANGNIKQPELINV